MEPYLIGQIAALLTAGLWTINSILFSNAGKKIGSISVNAYRIIMAVLFLSVTQGILYGNLIPIANNEQWLWIGLSGIVGLGIGDFGLFAAFVIIGPRRSLLIMSLAPVFGSIVAFFLLNETLSEYAILGMALTLIGISIVVIEKEGKSYEDILSKNIKIKGLIYAFIGAAAQGIGTVLAKKGMLYTSGPSIDPLPATLIRMILAAVFIWIVVLCAGKLPELKKAVKSREGMKNTALGAVFGPFLGVTLSMVAAANIEIGVAQTMMSLMPVIVIPILWFGYKQKTNIRGIIGALISIAGVAILFLI